jgi:hypothetical protein
MTPTTFRAHLDALGWSIRGFAGILGRPQRTVHSWLDRNAIPDDVAAWLQRRADAHEAAMRDDPPPGAHAP